MTGRVKHDRGGVVILHIRFFGAAFKRVLLRFMQVINFEIDVGHLLLLVIFPGPYRWPVVLEGFSVV